MSKTSLADIANALGVSKTLVSMVLNGQGNKHGINPDTQQRVRDMAEKLNYRPNPVARGLRMGRTNTIGLIVADIGNPFYATISRNIEDYARTHGFDVIFASSDENSDREKELINMMQNRLVDGLIISSTMNGDNSKVFSDLKKKSFPVVMIDRYFPNTDFDYVVTDNAQGSFDMTELLIKEGKRKIALFTISPYHLSSIADRVEGYKKALKHHNIDFDETIVIPVPFEKVDETIHSHLQKLVHGPDKVDAIFTLNNNLAGSCLKYFAQNNISVPNEVSVVSFDNVDWFDFSNPPLTGVAQPVQSIGTRSVEILIDKISKKNTEKQQVTLPTKLVIRKSV